MARPRNASSAAGADDVKTFLRDLRALRGQAGLKHGELARRAHFPEDTLKSAEHGPDLPTLPVLEAYVRACGGSPAEWEDRWRRLTTGAALDLGLPTRDPSAAKPPGGTGFPPAAPPAPVPAPRAADQELASRVVAALDAHSPATQAPATPAPATQARTYQPFVPNAPMTGPARASAQVPMSGPVRSTGQGPGLTQLTGTAPAPAAASTRPPRLRRTRMIIVLVVAVILAAVAVVWLARPASGAAHRAPGQASLGAEIPARTGLPSAGQPR